MVTDISDFKRRGRHVWRLTTPNGNQLADAEPLLRRAMRILAEFGHSTGHKHPQFHSVINNYAALLMETGLSENEIQARLLSAIRG